MSSDDPTISLDREIAEEFGFSNPVVWVLEARDGTVWTPAMLTRLATLTAEVQRIPGVIAPDVVGLASPAMRDLRVTEEGLEPTYLMGRVPETPEETRALRRRIEDDPNYAGTLVSRDGRAAMVVANVRPDVDARTLGVAALALRDRHRAADTEVWVTGAPVLAAITPAALAASAARGAAYAIAAVALAALVLGLRAAAAALVAALVGAVWLGAGVALTGAPLPWALEAMLPTALIAAAMAAGSRPSGVVTLALTVGFLGGAIVATPSERALWLTSAAGPVLGATVATLAQRLWSPTSERPTPRSARVVAGVLAAIAIGGVAWSDVSLGLLGYGERYLPPAAAADLVAVRRLFPPPVSLAVRASGEPGAAGAPAVLHALDHAAAVAASDTAVRSAMSLADVVKLVHRAFNDDRPEYQTIPDDPGLAGRYLALAYSPSLRRFVDRSFGATVLWIQLDGDEAADVARVATRVQQALAEEPPPGMRLDPPAGDGAVLLMMANLARRLAGSAGLAILVVAAAMAAGGGWRTGARALVAGLVAGGAGAGVLGWTGTSLDLVSIPLLALAAVVAAGLGGAGARIGRFGAALAVAGGMALVAPLPAAPLAAALLLAPGLALAVSSAAA